MTHYGSHLDEYNEAEKEHTEADQNLAMRIRDAIANKIGYPVMSNEAGFSDEFRYETDLSPKTILRLERAKFWEQKKSQAKSLGKEILDLI